MNSTKDTVPEKNETVKVENETVAEENKTVPVAEEPMYTPPPPTP